MIKKVLLGIAIFVLIVSMTILLTNKKQSLSANTIYTNRGVKSEAKETTLKVLVLEINPTMETVTNSTLYPNEGNHPKVSDYLNGYGSDKKALNELIEDLEYSSNKYIKVDYKLEEVNEYIKYQNQITLSNGKKANSLDEASIIKYSDGEGLDKGTQSSLISHYSEEMTNNAIDYNYYIQKYDLINKRNENEFDQVWLLTYEPSGTSEITIVGSKDLDVDGNHIKEDCTDFILASVSTKNRNSNFRHLLYGLEAILNKVFSVGQSNNNTKGIHNVYTESQLAELNLWERYTLSAYNNNKDFTGMGTLNYPPNAEEMGIFDSTTEVKSEYARWNKYPELTGDFNRISSTVWNNDEEIDKLANNDNYSAERLYTRWWASHIPHDVGTNDDGYYNNWWKYFVDLDFASSVMVENTADLEYAPGNKLIIKYIIGYNSGTYVKENEVVAGNNVTITNPDAIDFENGWLVAKEVGESELIIKVDSREVKYNIVVKEGVVTTTTKASSDDDVLIIGGKPNTKTTTSPDSEEDDIIISPQTDEEKQEKMVMYIVFAGILVVGLIFSVVVYKVVSNKDGGYAYD